MVVGILTVHSQINYGAILETYALQNILEKKGYKVVVLDRIMDKKTGPLLGAISNGGFLCWMRILVRGSIGLWDFAEIKRRIKSHLFIKKYLNLSSFKFNNWVDAPMDIGVDLLVLGSDQIWNTKHHDPHVFLLDGAPRLPAITYAASFGTKDIDVKYEELFKERIHSFDDISVREEYAKDILKRFKRVLICFDRDGPGMRNLRKISLKTGLNGLIMPKKFKAKDISDAISVNGFEKVKEYIYAEIDKEKKRRSSKECYSECG
jgi:hypothetical protein